MPTSVQLGERFVGGIDRKGWIDDRGVGLSSLLRLFLESFIRLLPPWVRREQRISSPILHHAVLGLEIGKLIGQGDLGIF